MVNVRLLADLPNALDSAAPGTILNKDAGGLGFDSASYDDLGATGSIDSAAVLSIANLSYLSSRISTGGFNAKNHLDSGVGNSLVPDSSGRTVRIGNYSKPINNLYLDSASTVYIGSNHSFSLTSSHIEFNGGTSASTFGASASAGAWYGDRGLHIGGLLNDNVTSLNVIQYFDITSTGDATDFGDLVTTVYTSGACSNSTYALSGGGYDGAKTNVIEYVTVSTTGNSSDFGDLTVERYSTSASSNGTYGLWSGGNIGSGSYGSDVIDYVTIASPGNATDFGNLTVARSILTSFANSTYSVSAGGRTGNASAGMVNTMDYVTVATTGNATDFGDLNLVNQMEAIASTSDETYGVIGGGRDALLPGDYQNIIQYVTIATPANATDFGDLTVARAELGGCGNGTRGVFSGGYGNTNGIFNTIDYITIASPSNATDLGDLLQNIRLGCATAGSPS